MDGTRIPLTDLVGHSYGINTWDPWSKMLANEFDMETHLYVRWSFQTIPFFGSPTPPLPSPPHWLKDSLTAPWHYWEMKDGGTVV